LDIDYTSCEQLIKIAICDTIYALIINLIFMEFIFKIGNKIKEAWPIYRIHLSTLLLLVTAIYSVQVVSSIDNWLISIISFIISIVLSYILIHYILSLVDGKEIDLFKKESIPSFLQIWNFFKTMILSALCVMAGFILLIIPGFYVAGRLVFAMYISVEKNQGARLTIKEAWKMTEGYGWILFWKSFVIGLFMALGIIAFFVGSFITYPLGMILLIMMYREFTNFKLNNSSEVDKVYVNIESKEKVISN
jgi:membrane-anchored glycerophosphoryl diester phosphodiesterase (GDPDase)